MSENITRRNVLKNLAGIVGGILTMPAARTCKAAVQNGLASSHAPAGYDPFKHKWLMALDVDRCIGCGLCVEACCEENSVPKGNFRTWIERYVITMPKAGSGDTRGETIVDSPDAGKEGFPELLIPKEDILKSFFVPKLCNLCENSPCTQVCPVGATFDAPDGAVLVDKKLLHRLRFLRAGLSVWMPLFQSRNPHRRQVYPVLPPDHAGSQARVRGDLSLAGPDFR